MRRSLSVLSKVVNSMPLDELAPDSRVVKHASGVIARALSTPRGRYAIYIDGAGPSRAALFLGAGNYSGTWIDIRTGDTTPLAGFHHNGGEKVIEIPDFKGGIALRLDRR